MPAKAQMQKVKEIHRDSEIRVHVVKRDDIPVTEWQRGREAFIKTRPFWVDLAAKLEEGLGPYEAIEIDLKPLMDGDKQLSVKALTNRIRYQMIKNKYDKKYSVLGPKMGDRLFIIDRTAAEA
jgi:hypothetical protein